MANKGETSIATSNAVTSKTAISLLATYNVISFSYSCYQFLSLKLSGHGAGNSILLLD